MVRDDMINAALQAALVKAGEHMRTTKDRDLQKEMAKEAAQVIEEIIELGREGVMGLGAKQLP